MNRELLDPPGVIRPVDNLVELAGRINAEHAEAMSAARASLNHARSAGLLLLEAKKKCGHGQWLPWIKTNVKFSGRTAQAYMRVAKRWPELEAKAQATADLSIEDGLKLLAEPGTTAEGIESPSTKELPPCPYQRNSIFEWTAKQRHETTSEWWDIFAEYVVLLDYQDWSAERIADFLGQPIEGVKLVLHPQPPTRFGNVFEASTLMKNRRMQTLVEEAYRNEVQHLITNSKWVIYRRACYGAHCEGWPDVEAQMRAVERHHRRQADLFLRSGRLLFDLDWQDETERTAWFCCALTDMRAALGIEPPRVDLLLVWNEFRKVASKLGEDKEGE